MDKYYTIRIDTDQNIIYDVHDTIDLDLKYLQKSVNGYIQIVKCHGVSNDIFRFVLIVLDEEGLLKENPKLNKMASALYGGTIVGDVVLTTEFNPDPRSEPDCYAFDEASYIRLNTLLTRLREMIVG